MIEGFSKLAPWAVALPYFPKLLLSILIVVVAVLMLALLWSSSGSDSDSTGDAPNAQTTVSEVEFNAISLSEIRDLARDVSGSARRDMNSHVLAFLLTYDGNRVLEELQAHPGWSAHLRELQIASNFEAPPQISVGALGQYYRTLIENNNLSSSGALVDIEDLLPDGIEILIQEILLMHWLEAYNYMGCADGAIEAFALSET